MHDLSYQITRKLLTLEWSSHGWSSHSWLRWQVQKASGNLYNNSTKKIIIIPH